MSPKTLTGASTLETIDYYSSTLMAISAKSLISSILKSKFS